MSEETIPIIGVSLGDNNGESGIAVTYREVKNIGDPYPWVQKASLRGKGGEGNDGKGEVQTRSDVEVHYLVRHLERPSGTLVDVIRRLVRLLADVQKDGDPVCLIDTRAAGHPAFAEFRRLADEAELSRISVREVVVSSAMGGTGENGGRAWVILRKDLITLGRIAFSTAKLRVSPFLKLAPTLREELGSFARKPEPPGVQDPWRLGQNDDLVLAVTIAVWVAERHLPAPRYREVDFWRNTPLAGG